MSAERPSVGVGIIIENAEHKILIMRRIGAHASKYSIPGGGLEFQESFEEAATRETREETGLIIRGPRQVGLTNNLETAREEGVHSISIIMHTNDFDGEPEIKEPHKASEMFWVDPRDLPEPHYDASRMGVECWLRGVLHIPE